MSTIDTIKKIAASTAIAASLGLGGLGLACGIASAAPSDQAGSASGASPKTEQQAPAAPKTATNGDDTEIHAHLIPGFTPKPATGTEDPAIPAHLIPGFTPKPAPSTTSNKGLGETLDPGQVCYRGQSCPVQHG